VASRKAAAPSLAAATKFAELALLVGNHQPEEAEQKCRAKPEAAARPRLSAEQAAATRAPGFVHRMNCLIQGFWHSPKPEAREPASANCHGQIRKVGQRQ
jgi:hypothetical protein